MVVYIDVLIFINLIINYCILSASQKFLHRNSNQFRIILSSFVGALFSLTIFLPVFNTVLSLLTKLICACLMCIIAFKYVDIRAYIKCICTTFVFSMLFSAFMIVFYQFIKPKNMAIINDMVYIHINPLVLILISVTVYLIIITLQKVLHTNDLNNLVNIKIKLNNFEFSCIGKVDTGNSVVEPFSCAPVIIVDNTITKDYKLITPRIIPYKVLGCDGIIYGEKAQKVIISNKDIDKDVYIGIYNGKISSNFNALINPQILR